MDKIRGLVVGVLLAVWCFPAVSSAKALPPEPAPPPGLVALGTTNGATSGAKTMGTTGAASTGSQATDLAKREQQAPNLQDFKGGGVVIYLGSGALLVVVIILLVLLI
jgi:hypothetical protein